MSDYISPCACGGNYVFVSSAMGSDEQGMYVGKLYTCCTCRTTIVDPDSIERVGDVESAETEELTA